MLIDLTQGKVAYVDDKDMHLVFGKSFCAVRNGKQWYALTKIEGVSTYLHHLIVGKPAPGYQVDHIDRDGLNNRRKNLRHVTISLNRYNTDLRVGSTSGYKGVTPTKSRKKWRASIVVDGKRVHLGYFYDPAEASKVYYAAAQRLGVKV